MGTLTSPTEQTELVLGFSKLLTIIKRLPEFSIIVSERGGAENRTQFSTDEVAIGRVQGNELVLPKGNVSKRHARIAHVEGRFVVSDLNSTNGTYVNRRRISQSTIVRFGDRIYIGDFVLRIEEPLAPYESASDRVRELQESIPDFSDQTAKTNAPIIPAALAAGAEPSANDSAEEISGTSFSASASTGEHDAVAIEDGSKAYGPRAHAILCELVFRVEQKLEPGILDREVSESVRKRVEKTVAEQWTVLEREGFVPPHSPYQDLLRERAVSELAELGPLEQIFADPAVTQLVGSGAHSLMIWREGLRRHEVAASSSASLERLVRRACRQYGDALENGSLVSEQVLANGLRLSAVLTGQKSLAPTVRLWRPRYESSTFDGLVNDGTISRAMATFLRQCVLHKANVLFVGARVGVQRLMSAAAHSVEEHCLVLHEGTTLCEGRPDATRLYVSGSQFAVSVGHLARIPGVRFLIEQLEPEACTAVFRGIADGADGVLAGAAARGFRAWWGRFPIEFASVHPGMASVQASSWFGATFDLVVEVLQLSDERFRVVSILETSPAPDGGAAFTEIFRFEVERAEAGGIVEGAFRPTGTIPKIFAELTARGTSFDASVFRATR